MPPVGIQQAMAHLLNVESSPRHGQSASIAVSEAFLASYCEVHPDAAIDRLNVWEENLPEFDSEAIGAKYKAVSGEAMDAAESALWKQIQALAARFCRADRIVLGVPMWNFAYPYKLKQLIDLVSQRGLLFRFDGTTFGPLLETPRALVIYSQGQSYADGSPTPASLYDHQTGYIDFWLRFIGVRQVDTLVVDKAWGEGKAASVEQASRKARLLAADF